MYVYSQVAAVVEPKRAKLKQAQVNIIAHLEPISCFKLK
jgi:hypothetical protein